MVDVDHPGHRDHEGVHHRHVDLLDAVRARRDELRADVAVVVLVLVVQVAEDVVLQVQTDDLPLEEVRVHLRQVLEVLDHVDLALRDYVRHLERVLQVLLRRVRRQHDVTDLDQLVRDLLAK